MSTITISNQAGKYNMNVLDTDLVGLKGEEYKAKYTSDSHGVQHLLLTNSDGDALGLTGNFDLKGLAQHDIVKAIRLVSSFTVTEEKHAVYSIAGIGMTGADLKNDTSFAGFLDHQTFKINGNDSANVIAAGNNNDQLFGNGGNDKLFGLFGNDKLDGGIGDDRIDAGAGNDFLIGGTGKNILIGGTGNDTYTIGATDSIVEAKGKAGGIDTIASSANADLHKFSNVENLQLTGSKNLKATGDDFNNTLTGNSGDNMLKGGRGNDTLTGGAGTDHFLFAKGDKIDTIRDFDAKGSDHDVLDLSGFGKIKFADLHFEKIGKDGLDIDFGRGDHIVFEHVKIKDFDASDFHF